MPLTVAIVGRPNVGKSTLFNRLVGRSQALVDPTPGVTRDRIEASGRIGGFGFDLIDTAGLDEGAPDTIEGRLRLQTERALGAADVALLLIDAKAGLTSLDHEVARWLRRHPTPIVLVANKCEGRAAEAFANEAWGLGLGAPVPISAQNGEGLADLAAALLVHAADDHPDAAPAQDAPLRLVVAGRPNVGKSSLINRLLEDDRLLTGPEPGLTRDAVRIAWQWAGRQIELVDTAGLRKRARIGPEGLERLSTRSSLAALRGADVALLVVEAGQPLERQDLVIANRVTEAGRALVLAVNKWDLVGDPKATDRLIRDRLEARLPQLRGLAWLRLSVRTGRGLERVLPAVADSFERWSKRVSTGELNRWLASMTEAHAPPLNKGRRIKLRYATQIGTQPPTFVFFVSQAGALPEAYLRYLANGLRQAFDLGGLPLRLLTRTGPNPYA
jgi:GTP-binding protein